MAESTEGRTRVWLSWGAVLLALVLPLLIVCGALALWWEEDHRDEMRRQSRLELESEVVRVGLFHHLQGITHFLNAGRFLWQGGGIPVESLWRSYSTSMDQARDLLALSSYGVVLPETDGRPVLRFASSPDLETWLRRPTTQAQLFKARDDGAWRLTSVQSRTEGGEGETGGLVLAALPVFRQTPAPLALEARRHGLVGWIVGVIDLGALVSMEMRERQSLRVAVLIDGRVVWQDGSPEDGLDRVGFLSTDPNPRETIIKTIQVGQSPVELRFQPRPELEEEMEDRDPEIILIGGILISVLLVAILLHFGAILRNKSNSSGASSGNSSSNDIRFHNLFLHNQAVAVLVSPDTGAIVDANLTASHFYGYSIERLRSMTLADLKVPASDSPTVVETEDEPEEHSPQSRFQFRHRLSSGEIRDVEMHSGPVELGGRVLLYSLVHDISDRRRAERGLKYANRILETLSAGNEVIARSSSASQLLQDICRVLVEVGQFRLAWVGEAQDDAEQRVVPLAQWGGGDAYLEQIHISWGDNPWGQGPAGRTIREGGPVVVSNVREDPHFLLWQERALAFGLVSAVSLPIPMKEGRPHCLLLYSVEVGAFDPETVHLLSRLAETLAYGLQARRDAECRRAAERALRASEARFRAVFDHAAFGITVGDSAGRLVMANPAFCRMVRRTPEEMAGCTWMDLTYPEDVQHNLDLVTRFRQGGSDGYALEKRYVTPKGHPVWCAVQVKRMILEGQEEDNGLAVAMVEDITERRRAEFEVRRSNTDLEQFAYAVSHDLQEPLRMISSYLQLLERRLRGKLDEECVEYIHYATNGSWRMRNMIRDLLDYSRIHSGGHSFVSVSLDACLGDALANLEEARKSAGPDTLITCDPLPKVVADDSQIMRLFQNLVGNALKYRSPARPVRVQITVGPEDEFWRISVTDNGIGIDPNQFPRLFQVFQRLHRDLTLEGTGVGLALCRRIVERHGGTIGVDSVSGEGSTFWFTLPQTQDSQGDASAH